MSASTGQQISAGVYSQHAGDVRGLASWQSFIDGGGGATQKVQLLLAW